MKTGIQLIQLLFMAWLAVPAFAGSFQPLGDLSGGNYFSVATGVSADGTTVCGYSSSTASGASYEAFRWTATNGMVALGDLSGGTFRSFAQAISADGTTVVGDSNSSNGNQAFRWTQATGMAGLGDLPGGNVFSYANAVSADGGVVAGESSSTLSGTTRAEAFRWTPTNGMTGLGDLPGGDFDSHAYAVSADGTGIIGNSSSSNGNEAFRWTAATGMVGLGDLAGGNFSSIAYGISADGSTIVGYGSPPSNVHEAFRRTTASGMVGLGFLPCDTWTIARAVSGDGSVIVGDPQASTCRCVFIWDAQHGLRELLNVLTNNYGLNLTGWQLCRATALSYDGNVIVGYGVNPLGQTEAWIADVRPPFLEITRAGDNIILSWATNAPNFILEHTSSLTSISWSTNSAPIFRMADTFVVTNSATAQQQFFRLRKP
jgi:probable HAF family extracellular repeat protein